MYTTWHPIYSIGSIVMNQTKCIPNSRLLILLSDTKVERNSLMEHVYPRLKEKCHELGYEFQARVWCYPIKHCFETLQLYLNFFLDIAGRGHAMGRSRWGSRRPSIYRVVLERDRFVSKAFCRTDFCGETGRQPFTEIYQSFFNYWWKLIDVTTSVCCEKVARNLNALVTSLFSAQNFLFLICKNIFQNYL